MRDLGLSCFMACYDMLFVIKDVGGPIWKMLILGVVCISLSNKLVCEIGGQLFAP